MRKLMIAAAIVCAAVCAQAASYTWGGTVEIYDWNNDIPGAGTVLFTIGGVEQAPITLGSGGTADFEYTVNAGDTVSAVATLTNFSDGEATMSWSFDFTQAFIDEKPTSDDALGAMTTDMMTTFDANGAGIDFTKSAADNGFSSVPEPTSGLLLLLSVAGLALKRKKV